jgi:hypothetical protein
MCIMYMNMDMNMYMKMSINILFADKNMLKTFDDIYELCQPNYTHQASHLVEKIGRCKFGGAVQITENNVIFCIIFLIY